MKLTPRGTKRAQRGHPWIFSNELDTPVSDLPPGGTVDVHANTGAFIGRGYANPRSLIAVRILTRNKREDIDHPAFFVGRLRAANQYRKAVYPSRHSMRVVHAEADGLPGLVVDRFGPILAVQLTTLGIEHRRDAVREALESVFEPEGAVLRNDGRFRELEGLPQERADWFGTVPEHVDIDENGVSFRVNLHAGQKTGHFFDQADNRYHAGALCEGRRVLDVYANTGGWALHALKAGATAAVVVDKSEGTCGLAADNAELNGFADRFTVIHDEGKKTLQHLLGMGERFGAVVLDPPAFAKTRKAVPSAIRGYTEINALGMSLVQPGGFLFTSSCSHHVSDEDWEKLLHSAAQQADRQVKILRRGQQSADHPVVPGIPETRYLKSTALWVTT